MDKNTAAKALNRLIVLEGGCNPGMSTTNAATVETVETVENNVEKLGTVCHVCEVKGPWALVHASATALPAIIKMGFSVHPSKKGGDYYAVKMAAEAVPVSRHLTVAPKAAPKATKAPEGATRLEIKGTEYVVRETATKRRQDVRRFEVRKVADELSKPYVVSFQSECGSEAACSCPDSIYRRRVCKHQAAIKAAFGTAHVATANVA